MFRCSLFGLGFCFLKSLFPPACQISTLPCASFFLPLVLLSCDGKVPAEQTSPLVSLFFIPGVAEAMSHLWKKIWVVFQQMFAFLMIPWMVITLNEQVGVRDV